MKPTIENQKNKQKPKVFYINDKYRYIFYTKNDKTHLRIDYKDINILSEPEWKKADVNTGSVIFGFHSMIKKLEKTNPEFFVENENYVNIDICENNNVPDKFLDDDCLDYADNDNLHPFCREKECYHAYYVDEGCHGICKKLEEEKERNYLDNLKKQYFDSQIFMGSGDCTKQYINLLNKRLNDGLEFLGGAQQEIDTEENHRVMEAITRDIAMALTGKKVRFE